MARRPSRRRTSRTGKTAMLLLLLLLAGGAVVAYAQIKAGGFNLNSPVSFPVDI